MAPQDMDGEELINYIHPGDLHGLKEVFTQAMIMQVRFFKAQAKIEFVKCLP